MKIERTAALLVIDIQQEDFAAMTPQNMDAPQWACIRNARRVLDVFRKMGLPVIQIKECHRPDMVDFGRELDGAEGVHCLEDRPENDFARLTYPLQGEYRIVKRRYSAFLGTDLEILLKGLGADTLYMVGGLTDVCVHYTAADAHQLDYRIRVVSDAVAGSGPEAHLTSLNAIRYLQRDALVTTAQVESALEAPTPQDEAFMREAIGRGARQRALRRGAGEGRRHRLHQREPDSLRQRPHLPRGARPYPPLLPGAGHL